MLSKAVYHSEANDGNVENQDCTEVGDTGLQSLEPLFLRCNCKHCMQDENIGEENKGSIQQQGTDHQSQGIEAIEVNVRAGQPEEVLVQAEGVRENVGSAVGEELQTDDDRKNRQRTSCQNGHHEVNDPAISQNGCVSQRIANCYKAIKSHGKKHSRLHERQSMNKISLGNAGIQTNLLAEPPDGPQYGVYCGQPHEQVSEGQHGQEVEHGLMQVRLSMNHM